MDFNTEELEQLRQEYYEEIQLRNEFTERHNKEMLVRIQVLDRAIAAIKEYKQWNQ